LPINEAVTAQPFSSGNARRVVEGLLVEVGAKFRIDGHHAADAIGIRGIVVHTISDDAKAFYLALGFEPSAIEPMTLVVTLADIRKSFT
jgi:hypothetical protein